MIGSEGQGGNAAACRSCQQQAPWSSYGPAAVPRCIAHSIREHLGLRSYPEWPVGRSTRSTTISIHESGEANLAAHRHAPVNMEVMSDL